MRTSSQRASSSIAPAFVVLGLSSCSSELEGSSPSAELAAPVSPPTATVPGAASMPGEEPSAQPRARVVRKLPLTQEQLRERAYVARDRRIAVTVCLEPDVREPDEIRWAFPRDIELQGTITEVGRGLREPPEFDSCPSYSAPLVVGTGIGDNETDRLAHLTWLRIRDERGASWTLSVGAPGFRFGGAVSDAVALQMRVMREPFGPDRQWAELRSAEGSLLFWFAEAAAVAELVGAPELERARGPAVNERSDICIPQWREYALDVGIDGTSTRIGYAQQARVGPWLATNAGVAQEVEPSANNCYDSFLFHARAALWPEAWSVPAASGIGGWCDERLLPESNIDYYYDDVEWVCLGGERYPNGYLSQLCETDAVCLPGARCSEGSCRAPCETDAHCAPPARCRTGDARYCE